MTRIFTLFGLILITLNAFTQNDKDIFWLETDSSYVFVDNSKHCWYTLEIPTDTFYHHDKMMFIARNKDFQVNNSFVNGGRDFKGAKGDIETEKFMLKNKKEWELKYQKKELKKRLIANEEFFYTESDKPILIWWFEMPPKKTNKGSGYEIDIEHSEKQEYEEHNVTHTIFIDFIIHGINSITISFSVLDNENLRNEIAIAKQIANSLNVYSGYIQVDLLERKIHDIGDYFFTDSLNMIKVQFPEKINFLDFFYKNSIMVSFPEKDNIYNAASILWQYKDDSTTFDDFIKERKEIGGPHDDEKLLCDSVNIKREFFTDRDSYFHCQNVYIQGECIYCFVNFTSTNTTYDYNIELFNELVRNIKLK